MITLLLVALVNDGAILKENDPLKFTLENQDNISRNVSIEIFDMANESIFYESYILSPEERIRESVLISELGTYRYEILLDENITETELVLADYRSNMGGSEYVFFDITSDPVRPIDISIAVA